MARYFPNDPWKIALRRNFVSDWLRTRNLQLPSLSDVMRTLHEYCKSACYLSLSLPDHMYPQRFLKKCKCCCVLLKVPSLSPLSCSLPLPSLAYYLFLLLPPALRAWRMACPYPPCCLHTGRQEQKGGPLLPLLEVRTFPLLQPGLTQCLQRKSVTEQHRS